MAFDVYVGSFTRYYRRDWENVAQKHARQTGMKYKMIYAGGEPQPPQPAAEIQKAVRHWCAAMQQGLGNNVLHPITWNEIDSPYFTDRPGWQGYTRFARRRVLVLGKTASLMITLPPPETTAPPSPPPAAGRAPQ